MSLYAEGNFGHPVGSVPRHDDAVVERVTAVAKGHDLQGVDLRAFYRDARAGCAQTSAICLDAAEQRFEATVLTPLSRDRDKFVVLSFAWDDPAWRAHAHHELLHAQYFLDARYHGAVAEFWASLGEEERQAVMVALASIYATDRVELVQNEAQAYLLQENAEDGMLGSFVSWLAPPLRERLIRAGAPPIALTP